MKWIFSFCVALLSFSSLWANGLPQPTRKIEGTIVDAANGDMLTGVRVMVKGMNQVVFSDETGHFAIDVPANDEAQLEFQLVSFQNVVFQVEAELQPIQVSLVEEP